MVSQSSEPWQRNINILFASVSERSQHSSNIVREYQWNIIQVASTLCAIASERWHAPPHPPQPNKALQVSTSPRPFSKHDSWKPLRSSLRKVYETNASAVYHGVESPNESAWLARFLTLFSSQRWCFFVWGNNEPAAKTRNTKYLDCKMLWFKDSVPDVQSGPAQAPAFGLPACCLAASLQLKSVASS